MSASQSDVDVDVDADDDENDEIESVDEQLEPNSPTVDEYSYAEYIE
jgi:hypothetical protein